MSKNTGLKNSIVLYEAYPYARPITLLVAGLFIAGCSYPATNWMENIGIILGLVCILWGIIKLFNKSKILCTFTDDRLVFHTPNKDFLYGQIAYFSIFYKHTPGRVSTSYVPYFKLQLMFGKQFLFLLDNLSPRDQTIFIAELKKHNIIFKGKQYEKGFFNKK
ncbi:hypothetical protein [Candidatus Avelusimicrobium fimicolum]|uniref:hypothetical protein n=1 Tax=Candidatus Avelusimicrobium fimicolum TaxID=3416216 RepID=UPI003D0D1162